MPDQTDLLEHIPLEKNEPATIWIDGAVRSSYTVSPRLLGSATHLVISELNLTGPIDSQTIERTVSDLIDRRAMPREVAENVDSGSIMAFFDTELGQKALHQENTVLREWPFTFSLPAADYPGLQIEPAAAGEAIVAPVQRQSLHREHGQPDRDAFYQLG